MFIYPPHTNTPLQAAEEMAVRYHTECTPRDLDPRVVTPTARLLARVRCALADVKLAAAVECVRLAAEDRDKARPKFPRVPGKVATVRGRDKKGISLVLKSVGTA